MGTSRFRRLRALIAGGLVLGVGSLVTLAAWTDTEWVWGGAEGDGENLGTSVFEMEQNADDPANWVQMEDSPGNQLHFVMNADRMSPGDTVFAPLQLRVVAGSLGGDVTLAGAILASGDQPLFEALEYSVRYDVPRAQCNATDFANTGTELVPTGTALDTGSGANSFTLQAAPDESNPGPEVDLCFALTLPADEQDNDALQGLTVQPAWAFEAISS